MNPMMLQMMMNNKMSDMGPLMPLFMTGKTAEDPLLMMMLMAQKADPKTTQNQVRDSPCSHTPHILPSPLTPYNSTFTPIMGPHILPQPEVLRRKYPK